jgi:hypothetical protein
MTSHPNFCCLYRKVTRNRNLVKCGRHTNIESSRPGTATSTKPILLAVTACPGVKSSPVVNICYLEAMVCVLWVGKRQLVELPNALSRQPGRQVFFPRLQRLTKRRGVFYFISAIPVLGSRSGPRLVEGRTCQIGPGWLAQEIRSRESPYS